MKFRNPTNGYIDNKSVPALWCALFGAFYFLASGVWIHALIMVLLAFLFIAWLGEPATLLIFLMQIVYCAFAPSIIEGYYLRRGWERIADGEGATTPTAETSTKKCPFCAETIKYEAIKCRHCGSDLSVPLSKTSEPIQAMSEQELMTKYNISFDGQRYVFQEYKYDKLADAVNYARRTHASQS